MNKEDVLTWLTQLGTGWVGLSAVYEALHENDALDFWDKLTDWHDGAYVTKRYNHALFERNGYTDGVAIEQYKLTKKAINSLNE